MNASLDHLRQFCRRIDLVFPSTPVAIAVLASSLVEGGYMAPLIAYGTLFTLALLFDDTTLRRYNLGDCSSEAISWTGQLSFFWDRCRGYTS